MTLANSQEKLLHQLKVRGPQSVKILARQLDMTTMGVRQHLADLQSKSLVEQTAEEKQTRGRPVHLWQLTTNGHARFPDAHSQVTVELIDVVRSALGEESLDDLVDQRSRKTEAKYAEALGTLPDSLPDRLRRLAELRSEEGYMAEVRLLPDGWLLIENHCPICVAAEACQQFCRSELETFQRLFAKYGQVKRVDHVLAGARRCAYKISAHN